MLLERHQRTEEHMVYMSAYLSIIQVAKRGSIDSSAELSSGESLDRPNYTAISSCV